MTDLLAATYLKENIRNMENDNIEVIDASRREMVEAIIAVENMMALVRQQPQKDGVNENAFWMAWVAGESEPLIDSPFGAGFNKESINNLPAEKKIEEILRLYYSQLKIHKDGKVIKRLNMWKKLLSTSQKTGGSFKGTFKEFLRNIKKFKPTKKQEDGHLLQTGDVLNAIGKIMYFLTDDKRFESSKRSWMD
eukprot:GHVL01005533.1.p1 GENE.GHVL01005533.1~~GHVL01005533.1.p1  ORF type:complete len:193 (+),score=34.79 GHVL01005533.1:175-753(+)